MLSNDGYSVYTLSVLLMAFEISFICSSTLFISVVLCGGHADASSLIVSHNKNCCYFSSSNIENYECHYSKNAIPAGIFAAYEKEHIKSFTLSSYLYLTFLSHI